MALSPDTSQNDNLDAETRAPGAQRSSVFPPRAAHSNRRRTRNPLRSTPSAQQGYRHFPASQGTPTLPPAPRAFVSVSSRLTFRDTDPSGGLPGAHTFCAL
ncbi:hypothetical protein N1851_010423 [Merluccius polli]|uniref:Uncharacterized protein n=1 Tax=Merluccius polli TaxID=89951 RepID=A0AA47MZC1_MERPO|nr:hypothetical protein N1851_010423 [Merluccius polli]